MTNELQTPNGTNRNAPTPAVANVTCTPRVDILETEEGLTLLVDMPGVKPQDVDVRFEGGELLLHGRCAPRQSSANWLLYEYGVGDFYRSFPVGEGVDGGKITAELKQGVLTVRLPRSEAVKPRKITVKGE